MGSAPVALASADHPRSRGVYTEDYGVATDPIGSSPLARGLRLNIRIHAVEVGIIPARAGFTHWGGRHGRLRTDHPRSRGVYVEREAR